MGTSRVVSGEPLSVPAGRILVHYKGHRAWWTDNPEIRARLPNRYEVEPCDCGLVPLVHYHIKRETE